MVRPAMVAAVLVAAAWPAVTCPADQTEPPATEPATLPATQSQPTTDADPALTAAIELVERSDRYLHHSRLRPGMTGYGLTVMNGTTPMRFDVEILAVMDRWSAHQDVILARLGGTEMERTGVAAGMSGSPVYVRDERDGRDKLIGAVAFAFVASKEPICGIQPITQMLTVEQRLSETQPVEAAAGTGERAGRELLAAALDPHRTDLLPVLWRLCGRSLRPPETAGGLVPLGTPLMVAGLGESTLRQIRQPLQEVGLLPVQAGVAASAPSMGTAFVPGSAISVALMTGDVDLSAVGTVTDVDGDHLLAFGHEFFAEGEAEFPVGSAQVHTVVPNLLFSFKLSSAGAVTGTLVRDERVGVAAILGRPATMIPMTVSVDWPGGRRQQFHYELARHRYLTPILAFVGMAESARSWRDLPELHTVHHRMDIDFGKLGHYRATNVASGVDLGRAAADLIRPLLALMNNPLGPPAQVRSIDVQMAIEAADRSAEIVDLKLDGSTYRPGETVTGTVTVRPFRQERRTLPVRFDLPADLPDGPYTLTACDAAVAIDREMAEMPQRFEPQTVEELMAALQRLTEHQGNRLYLRLPRDEKYLAVGGRELADLPESRRDILSQAAPPADTTTFTESRVVSAPCDYVLTGQATATFEVERETTLTPTRQ